MDENGECSCRCSPWAGRWHSGAELPSACEASGLPRCCCVGKGYSLREAAVQAKSGKLGRSFRCSAVQAIAPQQGTSDRSQVTTPLLRIAAAPENIAPNGGVPGYSWFSTLPEACQLIREGCRPTCGTVRGPDAIVAARFGGSRRRVASRPQERERVSRYCACSMLRRHKARDRDALADPAAPGTPRFGAGRIGCDIC
jgi:hypothetical protein